jgi:hypothetical protein
MPMYRALSVALLAVLFVGCSSTNVSVGEAEAYRGPLAAAVTPVVGGRSTLSAGERLQMQAELVHGLETAAIFASVQQLSAPDQYNEAEVIIDPSILAADPGTRGPERVSLRVRARRKSTGEIGIDETYKGRASGRNDAVADIIKPLSRDLKRKYGKAAVY